MNLAIELGLEIILRVPHLSFVIQGEDTINYNMTACLIVYMMLLVVAIDALVVAAAFTLSVVDVANANADDDVACYDARESAQCF